MTRRRCLGLSVVAAAALPLATACTTAGANAAHTPTPTPPSASTPAAVPTPARDTAVSPPELDGTETVAGRRGGTRGGGTLAFGAGEKGDALIVAVRCRGKGEIQVSVQPLNVGFPVACLAGRATTAYHRVGVVGAEKEGSVSVAGPSAVRWSLTVGREGSGS
ncbi:hypothetical protein ACFW9L_21705 [Streptomyces sp. NPDC059517]|uniref:hypothetical protein n=1 Tax=Streptomyces sp. NPDC059517 TaxID=3346855 RepID=UPI0036783C1A